MSVDGKAIGEASGAKVGASGSLQMGPSAYAGRDLGRFSASGSSLRARCRPRSGAPVEVRRDVALGPYAPGANQGEDRMTMVPLNVSAIDRYLEAMWSLGATDLHFTAGAPPAVRADGRLIPLADEKVLAADECAQLVLSVLNDDLSAELRREKETDFSFSWQDQTRFRGNAYFKQ